MCSVFSVHLDEPLVRLKSNRYGLRFILVNCILYLMAVEVGYCIISISFQLFEVSNSIYFDWIDCRYLSTLDSYQRGLAVLYAWAGL